MSMENLAPLGENQDSKDESPSLMTEGRIEPIEQQGLARLSREEVGLLAARIAIPSKDQIFESKVGPDVYLG